MEGFSVESPETSIVDMAHADLDARREAGIATYGVELRARNGRDALRDAYEEALDLACYLRQALAERPTPQIEHVEARDI